MPTKARATAAPSSSAWGICMDSNGNFDILRDSKLTSNDCYLESLDTGDYLASVFILYKYRTNQLAPPEMQPILPPPRRAKACAACKHRRRRCEQDCIFADYFSGSRGPVEFDNVHKVFGFSNMAKMIGEVEKVHRDKTMECIIYEANMRCAHPVEGCCGILHLLHRSIKQAEEELYIIRCQIAILRAHQMPAAANQQVEDPQFFGGLLQQDANFHYDYNYLPLPSLQLHQEPNQEQPSADINALLQEQMLNSASSSHVNHGAERVDIIRDVEGSIQEAQEHDP